jgi:hypothetical protein
MLSLNAKKWLRELLDIHRENDNYIAACCGITEEEAAKVRAEIVAFVAEATKD